VSGPATYQASLFGAEEPHIDELFQSLRRIELADGAWIELAPGWLGGHSRLFDFLRAEMHWRSEEREMYERTVDVPRLHASPPADGPMHPVLERMRNALDERYRTQLERISLALYRDGRDSVAWHGDYVARKLPSALVATVSVGAPRRFLLRPTGGGKSMSFSLGWGDLIVMGGSCQRTYQHSVPKVAHAEPRIAVMFRPVWEEH
jgi:alkylated DNA repair dioxygenase AlkB